MIKSVKNKRPGTFFEFSNIWRPFLMEIFGCSVLKASNTMAEAPAINLGYAQVYRCFNLFRKHIQTSNL